MIEKSAGAVIFRISNSKNIEFLFLKHREGHWEFPKGHLDGDESWMQACIREIKEETGLLIQPLSKPNWSVEYRLKNGNQKKVKYFLAQVPSNAQVIISKEHNGFKWFNFDEAMQELTYENHKHILNKVYNYIKGVYL